MTTGLNKESFYNLAKDPTLQTYMKQVRSGKENEHKRIVAVALERLAPPKPQQLKQQPKLSFFWGGVSKLIDGGIVVKNLAAKAIKFKVPTQGDLKTLVEDKVRAGFRVQVIEQDRSRLDQSFLKKQAWIGKMRADAKARMDKKMLIGLDRLEKLLQVDAVGQLSATVENLFPSDKQPVVGSSIKQIKEHIRKGEFRQAQNAIGETLKKGPPGKETELLRNIENLLKFFNNPLERTNEAVLIYDVEQIIKKSPLPQLYSLKVGLDEGKEAWRAPLNTLKRLIGKENPKTAEIFATVERLANHGSHHDALPWVELVMREFSEPVLGFVKQCVDKSYNEIVVAAKAKPQGADILKSYAKEDREKTLLQALSALMATEKKSVISESAKELRKHIIAKNLGEQLKIIEDISPHVEKQVDGNLVNMATRFRQMQDKKQLSPDKIDDEIKQAKEELKPHLEEFKQAIRKEDPYQAIAALKAKANRGNMVGTLNAFKSHLEGEIKGTYGIALDALQKMTEASVGDIPQILSGALKEMLAKEHKDVILKRIDQFRAQAGREAKIPEMKKLMKDLPEEGQYLVQAAIDGLHQRESVAKKQINVLIAKTKNKGQKKIYQNMLKVLSTPDNSMWSGILDIAHHAFLGESKDAEKTLTTMLTTFSQKQLKLQLEKLLASMPEVTLEVNRAEFEAFIAADEKEFGERFKAEITLVREALVEGAAGTLQEKQKAAVKVLKDLSRKVRLEAGDKKDEIAFIEGLTAIIGKDRRGIEHYIGDTMKSIVDSMGKSAPQDMAEMVSAIAKNKGPEFLLKHLNSLKEGREKTAKWNAVKTLLKTSTDDLSAHHDLIFAIEEGRIEDAKGLMLVVPKPFTKTLDAIHYILENEQARVETKILEAFCAIAEGKDAKKPLLKIFDEIKHQSDRMFFKNIADHLDKHKENGIEKFVEDYIKQTGDKREGAVPFHLNRIFQYFISPVGRAAVGNTVANRIMTEVMGPGFDKEMFKFEQATFNQKMNEMLDKLTAKEAEGKEGVRSDLPKVFKAFNAWLFAEGGGGQKILEEQVFGPILKKMEGKEVEDVIREWFEPVKTNGEKKSMQNFEALKSRFLSVGGAAALGKILVERYAKELNGDQVAPKRAEVEQRLVAQREKLGEGEKEMAKAAIDFAIKEIFKQSPDQEPKEGEAVLNTTSFMLSDAKKGEKLLYLKKLGPLAVAVNKADFKLILEVMINQTLIEGGNVLDEAAKKQGQNGYQFVCNIAFKGCEAMTYCFENPTKEYKFEDKKIAAGMAHKFFGKHGEKIGFTPFVNQMVMGVAAPGAAGAISFKLLGKKAIGEDIVAKLHEKGLYQNVLNDLIVNKMSNEIDKLTKGKNIYDFMAANILKKKGPAIEMSHEEGLLSEQMNKLAYAILVKVNPDLAPALKKHMKQVGNVMIPMLRKVIKDEFGVEELDLITPRMLYDYGLKKGAGALKRTMKVDEEVPPLKEEIAKISLEYQERIQKLNQEKTTLLHERIVNKARIKAKIEVVTRRILKLTGELKKTVDEYGQRMKEDKEHRKELRKEREQVKAEIADNIKVATKEMATLETELKKTTSDYKNRISEVGKEVDALKVERDARKTEIQGQIDGITGEKTEKSAKLYKEKIALFAQPLLKKKSFAALIFGAIGHFLKKLLIPLIWLIGKIVEGYCKAAKKDFKKTGWYDLTVTRKKGRGEALAGEKLVLIEKMLTKERLWKRVYGKILNEYDLVREREQH